MDPVYTDEKLGVFLKNVVQNRIFSIFLNFPKYCFFFGFWKLIFNILENSEKNRTFFVSFRLFLLAHDENQ